MNIVFVIRMRITQLTYDRYDHYNEVPSKMTHLESEALNHDYESYAAKYYEPPIRLFTLEVQPSFFSKWFPNHHYFHVRVCHHPKATVVLKKWWLKTFKANIGN